MKVINSTVKKDKKANLISYIIILVLSILKI